MSTDKTVWFVTGAGRGMGVDIARAALAAGTPSSPRPQHRHRGRGSVGEPPTCSSQARRHPPGGRHGRRGRCRRAFRPHRRPRQQRCQLLRRVPRRTSRRGLPAPARDQPVRPGQLTRAVLPVMRSQRRGLVVTISSTAGVSGQAFIPAYAAAKFGVEGGSSRWPPRFRRSASAPCGGPRLLPHRAAHGRLDDVARALDRRLRRADPER